MRISICIDALWFGENPIYSMREAKKCGVDNIEFWAWWTKDVDTMDKVRKELGMNVVALCTKFISLVDETKRDEYLTALAETASVAKKLECGMVITQVGDFIEGIAREAQHASLVEGLRVCVPILEENDLTLVFEPLNTTYDHKGYYLWSTDEAEQIADEVGSKNVKILFDLYHQQIMEGDIINRSTRFISKIGHMHCAGNPGRHELTVGEINYDPVFEALDKAGYDGFMGFEYFPLAPPCETITPWLHYR